MFRDSIALCRGEKAERSKRERSEREERKVSKGSKEMCNRKTQQPIGQEREREV